MLQNGVDVVLGPRRVDHQERCCAERGGVVIHENPVIPVDLVNEGIPYWTCTTHNNLALLKTAEEEMAVVFVCQFLRERTRSSMSVLMVGSGY